MDETQRTGLGKLKLHDVAKLLFETFFFFESVEVSVLAAATLEHKSEECVFHEQLVGVMVRVKVI